MPIMPQFHLRGDEPLWFKVVLATILFSYAGVMLAGAIILWKKSR